MFYRSKLILAIVITFCRPVAGQTAATCQAKVVVGRSTTDAGDGAQATAAQLSFPLGFSEDIAGNLYFADSGNNKIRTIRKDGSIQTVAGTGVAGSTGDGGTATSARLNNPVAVLVTAQGDVYVAEAGGNRVRKILAGGTIQTVAGNGFGGFEGDGNAAILARIKNPQAIALDSQGNLYIADSGNHRIRRVTKDGTIQTFAGSGPSQPGQTSDGQPAVTAFVELPGDLAMGADDTLYIAAHSGILSVTRDGNLHSLTQGYSGTQPSEGKPAKQVYAPSPSLALDAGGAVLFSTHEAGADGVVWRIDSDGNIHYVMDTHPGWGLLPSTGGTIIRSEANTEQIVRYSPGPTAQGTIASNTIVAGESSRADTGDGGPGAQARMDAPAGLATDSNGNLYITDAWAGRIRKLDTAGTITTIAGVDGSATPDGTPALKQF